MLVALIDGRYNREGKIESLWNFGAPDLQSRVASRVGAPFSRK